MPENEIRFTDGAAYERFMGTWSQLAGHQFLDWQSPQMNLRWLDVGCGNGAFTELLIQRCSPTFVQGIDPSAEQLSFARSRITGPIASFHQGDAMALPFPDAAFDAAVMPLVIFFVPKPEVGLTEMTRVVAPGGLVCAYAWDMLNGGFPYDALWKQMGELGSPVPLPPSPDASRMEVLTELWQTAGLDQVETKEINVQRTFPNFDEYWSAVQGGPSVSRGIASMSPTTLANLKSRMQKLLPADAKGQVTVKARANAVKGTSRFKHANQLR